MSVILGHVKAIRRVLLMSARGVLGSLMWQISAYLGTCSKDMPLTSARGVADSRHIAHADI